MRSLIVCADSIFIYHYIDVRYKVTFNLSNLSSITYGVYQLQEIAYSLVPSVELLFGLIATIFEMLFYLQV